MTRYKGGLVPREYYSDALTTDTYENVIDAFFAAFGKTTTYKDDTEAWLDYHYMPNPTTLRTIDAPRPARPIPAEAPDRRAATTARGRAHLLPPTCSVPPWPPSPLLTSIRCSPRSSAPASTYGPTRSATEHQDGDAADPVHNLGYLESTDSPPARNSQTFQFKGYVRPDLRIQDGDTIRMSLYGGTATATFFAQVTEEFDSEAA